MGEAFAGIVHPCKIYNILSLGLPFLAIGPAESHLTDLAARIPGKSHALTARHGDVAGLIAILKAAAAKGAPSPCEASRMLAAEFSQALLVRRFATVVEQCGSR